MPLIAAEPDRRRQFVAVDFANGDILHFGCRDYPVPVGFDCSGKINYQERLLASRNTCFQLPASVTCAHTASGDFLIHMLRLFNSAKSI